MYQLLRIKKKFLVILVLIIVGFGMIIAGLNQASPTSPTSQTTPPVSGQVKVIKVIDGDTIEIEGGEKVRLLGIDTPETVDPRRPVACFGKEASEENKKLVEGKMVILERDISQTDKYGRLLRYVYLKLDDDRTLFVNDHLLRQGFAQVSTYPPDVKFTEQFIEAEREARENNKGLWQKCR